MPTKAEKIEKIKKSLTELKPKVDSAKKTAAGKSTPEYRKVRKSLKRAQRELSLLSGKKIEAMKKAKAVRDAK